jgi:hypothetical protein
MRWAIRERTATIAVPFLFFSVANLGLLVAGRLRFGLEFAMSSWYICFTNPAVIGVYVGLTVLGNRRLGVELARIGLVILIAGGTWAATRDNMRAGPELLQTARLQGYYLRTYRQQADVLLAKLYPDLKTSLKWRAGLVRAGATTLEELGWNVFSNLDHPASPSGRSLNTLSAFSVDEVCGRALVGEPSAPSARCDQQVCEMRGWAADERQAARAVSLRVDNREFLGLYGLPRPDVAEALGIPALRNSGFYVSFATQLLGPGSHQATLLVEGTDGRVHEAVSGFALTIP